MNIFRILFFITFLSFIISFTGCQSNNSGLSDDPLPTTDSNLTISDIVKNKNSDEQNTTLPAIDIEATTEVQKISIVNGANISVHSSSEQKDITIMAFNSNGSTTTEGSITFQWPLEFIDKGIDFGTIFPPKATIVDGAVHFTYTAPPNLQAIEDSGYKGVKFLFHNSTRADVNVTLFIDFNASGDYSTTKAILSSLVLSDSSINVKTSNQTDSIDIYAYSDQHTTDIDTTLKIKYPDAIVKNGIDIGTLPSEITVVQGKAKLNYIGPSNLMKTVAKLKLLNLSNNVILNLYNQDTSINVDLNLTFLVEQKYTNYKMTAITDTPKIREPNQSKIIDIYLQADKNKPAIDEKIDVDYFDGSYGTINSFSGITDSNGHIAFEYKSPRTITNLNDFNITFKLSNNNDVQVKSQIDIDLDIDKKNYILTSIPSIVTITQPLESKVIDIYVENDKHQPAINEVIFFDYFDGSFGTVNSFNGVTDTKGHISVTYTSPKTVQNLKDFNITFQLKDSNSVRVTTGIEVDLSKRDKDYKKYTLTAVPLNSVITAGLQSKVIDIYLENDNHQPAPNESILLNYFDGSFGTINSFDGTTDANGHIAFEYTSVENIRDGDDYLLKFSLKNDSSVKVESMLSVSYNPASVKIADIDDIELTINNEIISIDVLVFDSDNNPYPDGNIKIIYPTEVLTGRDIGSFEASTVPLKNGKATFTYTAPTQLDANSSDIIFNFYHDSQHSIMKKLKITINPDPNQVVLTTYSLKSSLKENQISMGLNSNQFISFYIEDGDTTPVPDNNITRIAISLLNPALGELQDTTGRTGYKLEFNNKNNIGVNLVTKNISGVIPLKVNATFSDVNNNEKNITKIFNILVESGPPSAISFSYVGETKQIASRAKFTETWVLSVTDKYNNLVNTHPAISTGIMLGYTQSSDTTSNNANYLYFNPSEDKNGTIDVDNQDFTVNNTPFDNVDQTNEYLVTFGNGYRYNASGKWDINTNSSNKLDLVDKFEGNNSSNLGFAVGHNYRQDRCEEGVEWIANSYFEKENNSSNNNYIIKDTGTIRVIIEYDYYLVGKSVMLWANLIGTDNGKTVRIGEARKITLRGLGLDKVDTIVVPNGADSEIYRFHIPVKGIESLYSNAKFSYRVNSTNLTINNIQDSNGDLDNCKAYVDINVTDNNSSDNKDGSLTLKNLQIIDEF